MSERIESVSTKQRRIAKVAGTYQNEGLKSLSHHIDMEWMKEAQQMVRRGGAVGIDKLTAEEYEKNLSENLVKLEGGIKSGRYKAPPVRRSYVPKGNKDKRPIGIPTYEDKIAQRAIQMVIEPVYGASFKTDMLCPLSSFYFTKLNSCVFLLSTIILRSEKGRETDCPAIDRLIFADWVPAVQCHRRELSSVSVQGSILNRL